MSLPYETIGKITVWGVAFPLLVLTALLFLNRTRLYIARGLDRVEDKIWADADYNKGEKPDGWKHRAAFYIHIPICVLRFRKPLAFRWNTYKQKVHKSEGS